MERAKTRNINIVQKVIHCPICNGSAKRHSVSSRKLYELGSFVPVTLKVTYSKHYCPACRKYFNINMDYLADPASRYTKRLKKMAISIATAKGLTLEAASRYMRKNYHVQVPPTTLHDWIHE